MADKRKREMGLNGLSGLLGVLSGQGVASNPAILLPQLIIGAGARGLLDTLIPSAQANEFNLPIDENKWHSEYLYGRPAIPGVAGKYKDVRAGRGNKVLARLDLTAGERSGQEDRVARKSQGQPPKAEQPKGAKGPGLTNIHLFDEEAGKLKTERIGVTRGAALKGEIDFVVDQNARKSTLKSGSKTANTGVVGSNFPRMTEKQINNLKTNGVVLRYNPMTQNAFTDLHGRVVKPLNGYAWSEGGRVWVLDNNWSKEGVKFYESGASLPKDIRDNIKKGDMKYNFSPRDEKPSRRRSATGGGGFGGGRWVKDKMGRRHLKIM